MKSLIESPSDARFLHAMGVCPDDEPPVSLHFDSKEAEALIAQLRRDLEASERELCSLDAAHHSLDEAYRRLNEECADLHRERRERERGWGARVWEWLWRMVLERRARKEL